MDRGSQAQVTHICQTQDAKHVLNRRQPIDSWDSNVKQALNGRQPMDLQTKKNRKKKWSLQKKRSMFL